MDCGPEGSPSSSSPRAHGYCAQNKEYDDMSHQRGLSTSPSVVLSPSQDAEYGSGSLGKRWNGDGTGSVVVPDSNIMGVGGPRISPAGDLGPYGYVCPGPGYPRNMAGNRPVGSPSGCTHMQSGPIGSPIGSPVGKTRPIGSPLGQQRVMESPASQAYIQQKHPVGQQPNTSPLPQARILPSPLASPMSQTRLLGGGSSTSSQSLQPLRTESMVTSEDGSYQRNRGR